MWPAALAFLAAAAAIFGTAAIAALCALLGKTVLARLTAAVAVTAAVLYFITLLGSSLLSPTRELRLGEEKYICEIDCHLAYAVTDAKRADRDYQVTLRVRFDRETISKRRGDFPLKPGPRNVVLIDTDGLEYAPAEVRGLQTQLRPGEATEAQLRFDIPENAKPAYLRFEDADPLKRLLIGSETALLHRPTVFRLS